MADPISNMTIDDSFPTTIEVITTQEDLLKYRCIWDVLLDQSHSDNIFLCYDWIETWWKHFGRPPRTLHTIIVKYGDEVIGIAPFYKEIVYLYGLKIFSWTELRFIGQDDVVSPDYLDLIAQCGRESLVTQVIIRYFLQNHALDIVNLSDISDRSITLGFLQSEDVTRFSLENNVRFLCPRIDLPDRWEVYKESLSRNMRENLSRKRNLLSRKYTNQYRIHGEGDDLRADMNTLVELHQKRLTDTGNIGKFGNTSYRTFHFEIAEKFKGRGNLMLNFLHLSGRPVAAQYGYVHNDKYYFYQGGFLPEFGKDSVGFVLMSYIIQHLIDKKIKTFFFLRGNESYKYHWTQKNDLTINLKWIRTNRHTLMYKLDRGIKRLGKAILRRHHSETSYMDLSARFSSRNAPHHPAVLTSQNE